MTHVLGQLAGPFDVLRAAGSLPGKATAKLCHNHNVRKMLDALFAYKL